MLYGPTPLCWACERNDCFMSTIRTPLVRTIHPSPACVDVTGGLFTFGADLSLCLSPAFVPQELDAVRSLWDAFTAQCCPLQVQSDPAYASYQAWFGPAAPSCSCPALTEGNEYLVQVTEQGIWLLARDYPGFCHGLTHTAPVDSAPPLSGRERYSLPRPVFSWRTGRPPASALFTCVSFQRASCRSLKRLSAWPDL